MEGLDDFLRALQGGGRGEFTVRRRLSAVLGEEGADLELIRATKRQVLGLLMASLPDSVFGWVVIISEKRDSPDNEDSWGWPVETVWWYLTVKVSRR